jgi:hypothetical protein
MPTSVSVQNSLVTAGELRPTLPALEAWRTVPLETLVRAASDRLCLWDYQKHAPALTFFQVWQTRLLLQNVYMNRDPYVLPLRGAAVLSLRRLWGQNSSDTPRLRLSARLRLHPTEGACDAEAADQDSGNDFGWSGSKQTWRQRWLPPFLNWHRAGERRSVGGDWDSNRKSSLVNTEQFRLPGRLYLKLGTTIDLPGLMLWESAAERNRRRLYSTALRERSSTWWGFEWDFMRCLGAFQGCAASANRKWMNSNAQLSHWFLHASWIPTNSDAPWHLVAGVQHRFRVAKPRKSHRRSRRSYSAPTKETGFFQLTLRLGFDLMRSEIYLTPVADGTYF